MCLEEQFHRLQGIAYREDQETSGERVQTRQDGPEGQWPWSALEGNLGFTPSTLRHRAWPGLIPGG